MGKKSRRSNRKGRSSGQGTNLPMSSRRIVKLQQDAKESHENMLWSKAVHKFEEGLEIIQQFQNASLINAGPIDPRAFEVKAIFSQNLIRVEYIRCRFDKVVQIYNDIQISPEIEKQVLLSFASKLHGELAMLRLDDSNENKERVVSLTESLIDTRISEGINDPNEVSMALEVTLEAVRILRNLKEYDLAIALGEKLGRLPENGERPTSINSYAVIASATFENTITHLERYRVEYHHQLGKVSRNHSFARVLEAFNKFDVVCKKSGFCERDTYFMMMAQRNFLSHQVDEKELSSQLYSNAIGYVEGYLEAYEKILKRHCFTCKQAGTANEVQLVCSGCRVACYCSLDHQRMTWKKDAIKGMRIGHEILCPLMKAYRKWKLASKKGDHKALKLRRRLDRECLYFLSHGLGLKDKCFQEKEVCTFIKSPRE